MTRKLFSATTAVLALGLWGCVAGGGAPYYEGGDCRSTSFCPSGYYCESTDGVCYPAGNYTGCVADSECGNGAYCAGDGNCYLSSGCTSDAYCAPGDVCLSDGLCHSTGSVGSCSFDSECPQGNYCASDGNCYLYQ